MKKIQHAVFSVLLAVLIIFSAALCLSAEAHPSRLIDKADVLNRSEEEKLLEELDRISEENQFEVVIVITEGVAEKDMQAFADDYYDYNGYGLDSERSGILFALSFTGDMKNYAISTTGYGQTAFKIDGMNFIIDSMRSDVSDEEYADAFHTFAFYVNEFVIEARKGTPYDTGHLPTDGMDIVLSVIIGMIISLIITLIVMFILKSQLKSVKQQKNANNYIKNDSLQITGSRDMFLYHTVSRVRRETESSSGSGSGSHTSSSGSSHGGTSGHF